ncbi:hypothetical protein ACFWTE_23985 [Nocardiopsis sp. NPDC058631]|uniref:hypothetical protein n=1 Tax=Nocardiopsis sp. NPDC058631 TaxID=3346566 RepID=UPI00364E1471
MPAEFPTARHTVRFVAALACTALALTPLSGALAQTVRDAPVAESPLAGSPAENRSQEIADALDESPVYVDPAYANAIPEAEQERIAGLITGSDLDLYVIAVPLVEADTWNGDVGTLLSVVHDRRGAASGHYLAVDDDIHGEDFGGGLTAHYAALTSSYGTDFDDSALVQLDMAVEAALSGDPEAAYDQAVADYQERNDTGSGFGAFGSSVPPGAVADWLFAGLVVVGVALLAVPSYALYRRVSANRERQRSRAITQHAAFTNAERAQLDALVEQGAQDLIEVGERLSRLESGSTLREKAQQHLRTALDARSAAAVVHDRMAGGKATLPDAVGVLVLLDMAEDAIDNAARGPRAPAVRRLPCYANPLHGTLTKVTAWREFGGTRTIRVPLCEECAKAVRSRVRPVVLPAEHGGRTVPYYEMPADSSVWAATGYGTLTDDLVERIQRGDHTRNVRSR